MAAPFYFLFLPLALIIAAIVWGLYFSVARDKNSHLRERRRSDLEKAQEMERQEEAEEMARRTQGEHRAL